MSVQSILDRKGTEVITIQANETVRSAANLLRYHRIAALAVKTGDAITGLISERDIVHAISEHGERALSMPVREVAPRTIITVEPADTLKRAMSLMTHHRVRHLLVTAEGKFVGIISIGDAVKYRLEDLETESNVLRDAYISAH
jgi:CBS domain-containing protein